MCGGGVGLQDQARTASAAVRECAVARPQASRAPRRRAQYNKRQRVVCRADGARHAGRMFHMDINGEAHSSMGAACRTSTESIYITPKTQHPPQHEQPPNTASLHTSPHLEHAAAGVC